ncbi:hypothetical protein LTR46_001028 [Exophiala xenobiotica]|nr:hypothetical protein LTR18_002630 [Exophiala xenobiotica]KAK5560720.1 hypothetical protein LTR46_001028 [Exophiala xenobiotica]
MEPLMTSEEMEKQWTRAEELELGNDEANHGLFQPHPVGQDDAMHQAMLQYLSTQNDSTYGIESLDTHTAAEKGKGKATVSHDDFNPTPYPDTFPSVFEDNYFDGSPDGLKNKRCHEIDELQYEGLQTTQNVDD